MPSVSSDSMAHDFLAHLRHGPSSVTGWIVFGVATLAWIVWWSLAVGYTDEVPDAEAKRLGSFARVLRAYAPPRFVRSQRWVFPMVFILYVISVYI
jgi:hypothetical protein